ncbi:MAG: response regulator, partial [Desulfosarcina sp.]
IAVVVAIGTSFFISPTAWALLTLAMGVVCLSMLLYCTRLEKKELAGRLVEQGDRADRRLKAAKIRYHNALLVQKIGQTGSAILEVKPFLRAVLKSMARHLDFNRGLILLLDDERQRLGYMDSYGFLDEVQPYLATIDYAVDLDHSSDIFIRAIKTGGPVVLNALHGNTIDLAPNSKEIIERLGVDSLIGVPLIHRKTPLGLLFVGNRDARREHAPDDVDLIEGIASHIAAGIVNARSFDRIQKSEQHYRLIAENVTDVIWILDIETFKMQYVTSSVESAQGFTPDEIMGLSIDRYLSPESFQKAVTVLGEAMERVAAGEIDPKHHSVTLELDGYRKDRTVMPIEVTAGFLLDENDRPRAVLGISRDLSERKNADRERTEIERRLQRANKMESLGTMAGSIAHNFNNLLMVVLGNLELAKETLPEESATTRNIQRAVNASQRAADLSGMMLTYVGQLKKESVPVDLSHMVKTALKNMDESTMASVTMDLDLADPMPLVIADAAQMRQMISGFVTNAIEALGREKGRVRISTGSMRCDAAYLSTTYLKEEMPPGIYAYVEVADTGCGMDAETMGKVFDPFFSTKFTGRGLGMAAVMGIIRSHKGVIKVNSRKNHGSVFTALFPIHRISREQATPVRVKKAYRVVGRTVLLVDDEEMVMDIGRQFLERIGYTVRTAACGRDALAIFEQAPDEFDCLLLDFTMPDLDGLETMQRIKKIRPDAKIIITSGYTRQQIEDRFALIDPPDDFIQKPFEMQTLQKKLGDVISRSG